MASQSLVSEPSSAFAQACVYCSRALPWVSKGFLAILDQGLISGSNFLIGIVLARWLVPGQYGAYALAFSIFLFAAGFHNALLLEPMSVFGPASYGKCLPTYVGKLLKLHFVLAFFLTGLVIAGIVVLHYFTPDRSLAAALWGASLATPLVLFFWVCRRAAYLKLAPGVAAGGATVYSIVVMCLLFLTKSLGWLSSFVAFVIQSLGALIAAAWLLASLRPQPNSPSGPSSLGVVRQHWRYGRWAVGTQFVFWLSGNAYYVIVASFLRMQDVAALRALQNFTLPFGQFITAIGLLVLPWSSARFAEEGPLGFRRRVRQLTLLFGGGASAYYAVLCLFGARLVRLLYAGRYNDSAYLLTLVAAPIVLLAASEGSMIALQAMQTPADVFLGYAASALATVLAGVPLTRYWGLPGAALGILISYLTFFVVIACRCRARLRQPLAIESQA